MTVCPLPLFFTTRPSRNPEIILRVDVDPVRVIEHSLAEAEDKLALASNFWMGSRLEAEQSSAVSQRIENPHALAVTVDIGRPTPRPICALG
jgi:hypothetical protein